MPAMSSRPILEEVAIGFFCSSSCEQACEVCLQKSRAVARKFGTEARLNNFVFTGQWLDRLATPPTC